MTVKVFSLKNDGKKNLTKNFKVYEFACKDGSDKIVIDSEIVDIVQKIRDHIKKPIVINSAYRTPSHNKKEGGSPNSQHLLGKALDIKVEGVSPKRIAEIAKYYGADGIGVYSTFTHIDCRGHKSDWKGDY